MSPRLQRAGQTAKSAALVLCGLAWMARGQHTGQGAVLTFHGLREDGAEPGVLDASLHLPEWVFRAVCEHLAAHYRVMPLAEMVRVLRAGERLPPRAVAITFDDGYASNYRLGFPVLRELGLPATVFLATGFLDGTHALWFQEVDRACAGSPVHYPETLARLKSLPDAEMRVEVAKLCGQNDPTTAPAVTQPMTWNMAREMRDSGLIDFGGHTHTHPILARCSAEQQAAEIQTCRARIETELGKAPSVFAFPNGGPGDFTEDTQRLLRECGYDASFTMMSGRLHSSSAMHALPRYGSPETVWEAEATASGAFEMLREWRGGRR